MYYQTTVTAKKGTYYKKVKLSEMISKSWFLVTKDSLSQRYYLRQATLVSDGVTRLITGSKQGGLAEAVMQAVAASPEEVRSLLLANIALVGGNSNIPGFAERLFLLLGHQLMH